MKRFFALAVALFVFTGPAPAASASQAGLETRLSAAFQDRILPALRRAETDPAALDGAVSGYFGWLREGLLLGFSEDAFANEEATALASLTTGLKNAYAKTRATCPGIKPTRELIKLARQSMLFGWSEDDMLFPTFDEDVRACTPETVYRITVRSATSDEKHGVLGNVKYVAFLAAGAKDSENELEGIGTYSGFHISTPKETPNYGKGGCTAWGKSYRFRLSGAIDATGGFMDMSFAGGANGLTYTLATTDWPLKPLFVDLKDAYAQTSDEKEAVSGLGTIVRMDPIALKERVTTVKDTRTQPGGECAGTVTMTEDIRIERIGR